MSPENTLLTDEQYASLEHTALRRDRLEEQYENLDQQHQAAALGMWVFLGTEVMFFGALFLAVGVYHHLYTAEFEKASLRLNWVIGGINTIVLLVSSLMIVLAVHCAKTRQAQADRAVPLADGALGRLLPLPEGIGVLHRLRGIPDSRLAIPCRRLDGQGGLRPDQVPHVKLFLFLYWVMTALHGLHVTIGIVVVLVIAAMAARGRFSPEYYAPVDVTALYWHFVDIVWIFLLPTLYLLGTHHW